MKDKEINSQLYRHISVFYSLTLKEFKKVLGSDFNTLAECRASFVFLSHYKHYSQVFKTKLIKLYSVSPLLAVKSLRLLVDLGFLKKSIRKVKTNIGVYVGYDAYYITVKGADALNSLNDLISDKINKLSK